MTKEPIMVINESRNQQIDLLVRKMHQAASVWRDALKHVGLALTALRDAGVPLEIYLRELSTTYGIHMSTAQVAMSWANGTLGTDEEALVLTGKFRHSDLAKWTPEVARSVLNGTHRVIDARERHVVDLSVKDMDQETARLNSGPQGILPLNERMTQEPQIRKCKAVGVEDSEFDLRLNLHIKPEGVIFRTGGREPIHMFVPYWLIEEANRIKQDNED